TGAGGGVQGKKSTRGRDRGTAVFTVSAAGGFGREWREVGGGRAAGISRFHTGASEAGATGCHHQGSRVMADPAAIAVGRCGRIPIGEPPAGAKHTAGGTGRGLPDFLRGGAGVLGVAQSGGTGA